MILQALSDVQKDKQEEKQETVLDLFFVADECHTERARHEHGAQQGIRRGRVRRIAGAHQELKALLFVQNSAFVRENIKRRLTVVFAHARWTNAAKG